MSTLSVTIANYNHGRFIGLALEAILSQSRRPDEVIIVDDGSTDDSIDVIQRFVDSDPAVRLYRNERNQGVLYSGNRALSLATGDYVYSAASDDRVLPGLFEKSMKILEEHPNAGLCCSDPAILDDRTGIVSEDRYQWSEAPCYLPPAELADKLCGWYIAGHTAIIKRSAILEAGGLEPQLKWYCDWLLSMTIAFRHGACYVPEPLATIRRVTNSYSAAVHRNPIQQEEALSHLLHLIQSRPYRDVLPYFMRSGAFAHFGADVVRTLMSRPEHWNTETMLLLQLPLHQWSGQMTTARQKFQRSLNSPVQSTLWRLTPWIKELCARDGVKRIFFYGAGSHTETFLNVWKAQDGLPVEGILVTELNGARELKQLPILAADDFQPRPGDGIVISSATYETQIAAYCRKRWPEVPYYPLYSEC